MNRRKRHLLVDITGLVLHVVVHPANVLDREEAKPVLEPVRDVFPRPWHLGEDVSYQGARDDWLVERLGWRLEILERSSRWV